MAFEERFLGKQSVRSALVQLIQNAAKQSSTSGKTSRESSEFSADTDAFALITLRGTDVLLRHFGGLLEFSRHCRDAAEFEKRFSAKGFLHKTSQRYANEIRTIIEEHEQEPITTDELFRFLRVIHLVSLDLNTTTSQSESMIKSLLAISATGPDPVGAADASWNELLREVTTGMPNAKSYCRDDLPQTILDRQVALQGKNEQALQRLSEHSDLVLNGIRSTLGSGLQLGREKLVQRLWLELETHQIVVVTGPAGSGKSSLGKNCIAKAAETSFTSCFRAEEFNRAHLDETLQQAQIGINGKTLGAILVGQSQKYLLIESVERLLEASTRDAFTDLLSLIKSDPSWKVILTCRDYSVDVVRSSLLSFAGVQHGVLAVPPLGDEELTIIETHHANLALPLRDPKLRDLLRNPYMLDRAIEMPWHEDCPLPEGERAFREKFWADIVRKESQSADDLPRRRQQVFGEVALRRARALTLFASCQDLDPRGVQMLKQDSLLVVSDSTDSLVAPAHDVLEDWAILHWIDEQYALCQGSFTQLGDSIGTHPAVRRTFRKWTRELVERDVTEAGRIFRAALEQEDLPGYLRDDTLVSMLQADCAPELLGQYSSQLFEKDRQLLRRIVHLLRVGCMTAPPWLPGGDAVMSVLQVPEGRAWRAVLEIAASQLDQFSADDCPLLLGLIEDASRGVTIHEPYPAGSDATVRIAYWLWPQFSGYRSEGQRERVCKILAKLPKCDPERFKALLVGDPNNESNNRRASEILRKLVLSEMDGMQACRDLPDAVIQALRQGLLLTEEMLQDKHQFSSGSLEVDSAFGINEHSRFESFPPSAFHGPFLQLLRFNPQKALAFIHELFNHSAEWYGNQRIPMRSVEAPFEVVLEFSDGLTQTYWCNSRLWNLYRGTSVGPYALQSALMALEHWLYELGKAKPDYFDDLLLRILRTTKSGAIVAVVASIATAYPHQAPETLLVLLNSQVFIQLDRSRLVAEGQSSALAGMMPSFRSESKIFGEERRNSNSLEHRRHDLETAIANLQLGPHAPRAHEIIDSHLQKVPRDGKRSETDRIWLLALHRMDMRRYQVAEDTSDHKPNASPEGAEGDDGRAMIKLEVQVDAEDVQQMMQQSYSEYEDFNLRISLLMWGIKVFEREDESSYDPNQWRERLSEAQAVDWLTVPIGTPGRTGPVTIAAICIRDHYEELTEEEMMWCVDNLCSGIEETADHWSEVARIQIGGMEGDRPAARTLPLLLTKALDDAGRQRVMQTFVLAMTHAIDEVRIQVALGVGEHVTEANRDLAIQCVNAIAAEAALIQVRMKEQSEIPFNERMSYNEIDYDAAIWLRREFASAAPNDAYDNLDVSDWTGSEANVRALSILVQMPEDPVAIHGFRKLCTTLVDWWDADDDRRSRRERSDKVEPVLTGLLEQYVLNVPLDIAASALEPVLAAIPRHPRSISWIVQGIIGLEDRRRRPEVFWPVWKLFADRVRTVTSLDKIDERHSHGQEVLAAIFLTKYWKDGIRHWETLEGHAHNVHDLFDSLPTSARVFDCYVRFLYHVGNQSLPQAFVRVADKLQSDDPRRLLKDGNTVFMLEALLRRYVYGRPLELKQDPNIRTRVLYLLDTLVEQGSSSAFRMRDDFVTPAVS